MSKGQGMRGLSRVFPVVLLLGALTACTANGSDGAGDAASTGTGTSSVTQDPSTAQSPTWTPTTLSPTEYAQQLFLDTNKARTAEGLPALEYNTCAESQALPRAKAITSLVSSMEHAPMDTVEKACFEWNFVAENLSQTDAPPDMVVDAWMASPGHRSNLLDPNLDQVGIACNPVSGELTCSEIFLGKQDPVPSGSS